MITLPAPLPLEMPPGDADALDEVVSDIAGAGFHLTVLSRQLAGPAASAPGWLGADAVAAAAQVGVVASLAGEALRAVLTAMHRLSAHADGLHEARRQVTALRREQDDDRSAAWARLNRMDQQALAVTEPPDALAVVEEWRASEASRQRRHAAVLEDVAADAAATARVLADCCAIAGEGGVPGHPERVVAFLAARLPGWGDAELAARGRAFVEDLMGGPARPEEIEAMASSVLPLAAAPAFATSVLRALGPHGVETLLTALGSGIHGDSSAVARVLAAALGGAVPADDASGTVRAVLDAAYVRGGDHIGPSDGVAVGMAAVLVAAVPGTRGGLRLETVVEWSRQLLHRERAQGVYAGAGVAPSDWDPRTFDPAALALGILAARGEPAHAADLLGDREAWDALLAREWRDGGRSLDTVVWLAGEEAGRGSRAALRAGLEALGGELEHGDPDGWTVARRTAAHVAAPLAAGLAAHPTVVTELLGVEGELGAQAGGRLRGLAYLTIDRPAAAVVERALSEWAVAQPARSGPDPGSSSTASVTIPAAYLAVQEYGQRLDYALLAHRLQQDAESREFVWSVTGHLFTYLPRVGDALSVVEPFVTRLLGVDGSWEIGPDRGLVFDQDDAQREAEERARRSGRDPDLGAIAREARDAFARVDGALGPLETPRPPETHWWDPFVEALDALAPDRLPDVLDWVDGADRRGR